MLYIAHSIRNPERHLGIKGITIMARMTPHQPELAPIKWKRKYEIYQERRGVIEKWLYVKGKDAVIYDPSSDPCVRLGGFIV